MKKILLILLATLPLSACSPSIKTHKKTYQYYHPPIPPVLPEKGDLEFYKQFFTEETPSCDPNTIYTFVRGSAATKTRGRELYRTPSLSFFIKSDGTAFVGYSEYIRMYPPDQVGATIEANRYAHYASTWKIAEDGALVIENFGSLYPALYYDEFALTFVPSTTINEIAQDETFTLWKKKTTTEFTLDPKCEK
ncbi:lipoprotein [Bdellovibrio sp. HCB337]|uniref:lipoprotein n=1 Tax=Bdellovibrio sp. HCB337 TaxID=3394358 RepID=UPI0039A6FC24